MQINEWSCSDADRDDFWAQLRFLAARHPGDERLCVRLPSSGAGALVAPFRVGYDMAEAIETLVGVTGVDADVSLEVSRS